jgi:hypothetical protein
MPSVRFVLHSLPSSLRPSAEDRSETGCPSIALLRVSNTDYFADTVPMTLRIPGHLTAWSVGAQRLYWANPHPNDSNSSGPFDDRYSLNQASLTAGSPV